MSTAVFANSDRHVVLRRILGAGAISIYFSAALPAAAADAPTGGMPGTRAFILSNIYVGNAGETGACGKLTDSAPETFLKSLPSSEQQNYAAPDKHNQLFALMQKQLGFKWIQLAQRNQNKNQLSPYWDKLVIDVAPEHARIEDVREQAGIPEGKGAIVFNHHIVAYDSCTDPQDFPMLNTGFHPYDGKLAFGIDLDGKRGRDQFNSPSGEPGVDNQLWRVLGCMKHFREFGNPENADGTLFSAAAPTLIEISRIDDTNNDSDVSVAVFSSIDPLIADGRGVALANASYTIDTRPELIAHTRGRIVNGVLSTDPVDLTMHYKEQIIDGIRQLRGVRIRATLNADGSIKGGFYGYYMLDSFYDSIKQMTQLGANLSNLSCPVIHSALQRYADGYPDATSGRNTAISSALNFIGVAAFAIQPSAIAEGSRYAH
ncbi:MAG TPA: hypothetical protein VLC91_00255 [Spongiibacteraceae bacterium]|nr:hypothetical protein [Spongiibacteraceae bacterium]